MTDSFDCFTIACIDAAAREQHAHIRANFAHECSQFQTIHARNTTIFGAAVVSIRAKKIRTNTQHKP